MTATPNQIIAELNGLLTKHGIKPVPVIEVGPMRTLADSERAIFGHGQGYEHVTQLAEIVQEEIGAPGQRVLRGQIQTDKNPVYGPMFVRGYSGNPGLYDEVYRTEPLIYDAIRTHTETLVSGTWTIEPPEDKKRTKKAQRALDEFCDFHNGKFRSLAGGWHKAVEHFGSMLLYGFAASELVWGLDTSNASKAPRPYLHKIAWRYPATVYQWILDERGSELLGCHFRVAGDRQLDYVLPAFAPRGRPWERKLLLQSIGGWGNDFEGVAPMRTVLVLWKIKQLLLQISTLAADTYGIPLTVLSVDPVALANGVPTPTQADIDRTWNILKSYTALDAARIKLPPGLKIESISPTGQMPSMLELIEYLDRMLLVPFSNEGSLLGMSGGGAYALGVVKERETLRTAPYYARLIADPINEIIRDLAIYELGEMPDYPRLVWRMDGMEDASAWSKDALSMIQQPLADWPKPARAVALDKLDLPPDTFAEHDDMREAERAAGMQPPPQPGQTQQGQAAGGGQQAAAQDDGESVTGEAPQDGPERPKVE
jgi:hypothetical protein